MCVIYVSGASPTLVSWVSAHYSDDLEVSRSTAQCVCVCVGLNSLSLFPSLTLCDTHTHGHKHTHTALGLARGLCHVPVEWNC